MRKLATQKRSGAVAFEYVIILVIMAALVFAAFAILAPAVMGKVDEIAACISTSGFSGSGVTNNC